MACLYLMRDKLHEITVMWANTGKNYPELLQTVEKAKAMCPNWTEVKVDRDSQWGAQGLPSDIVPIDWTNLGQQFSGKKNLKVQSYLGCCYENITGPLLKKTLEMGATTIIKGQRLDESHRSTAKSGDVINGITFIHPIESWSKEDVLDYLKTQMEIPEHYSLEHSSMDCYDCTAYVSHSKDRVEFMRDRHPELHKDYMVKMTALRSVISRVFNEVDHG